MEYDVIKRIVVDLVKKFYREGATPDEFPIIMAEIVRIFYVSWAKSNGLPETAATDMVRNIAEAMENTIIDRDSN